ncbi:MAG: penicillin acylase family protein [Planctomycetota bacterium]|nr:penicillin acylase family protein [Planctomycetota bacterium]
MKSGINIQRDENGVPHVQASQRQDVYWGQGYVHGHDRALQLILMRILGTGRLAEFLDPSDDGVAVDRFFRRMNWSKNTETALAELDPKVRPFLDQYCDGVNAALNKSIPWELKLLGYRHEAWTVHDCIMLSRMIAYLTLVQSQAEMERLFIEIAQAGISQDKLEDLFPGLLEGMDLDLIKKVKLGERLVPENLKWSSPVSRMMASNNWVVAGHKTKSKKAMLANDPHLETNRLPNVWCEMVLSSADQTVLGGTMPGVPGVLSGRNNDLAWGVTYAFIDSVDSWIEHCKDGKYFRGEDDWRPFEVRKETIARKKASPVEVTFYENEHGVLDGDPFEENHYLATRWAAADKGGVTLSALLNFWEAKTVDDGMAAARQVETGWSFVMADQAGDIAFQMSGIVPKRRESISGFIPLAAWDKENDWDGFHDPKDLPSKKNPECGFFTTANNDLNEYGQFKPINMPMGSYRSDRISEILKDATELESKDFKEMHYDVQSVQARLFMEKIKPLLPDSDHGRLLRDWDGCYDRESKGAMLFEDVYKALYQVVFGKNGFGEAIVDHLAEETGTFIDFYANFDRILLAESSPWFGDSDPKALYQKAINKALTGPIRVLKDCQTFTLKHILLGDKVPGIFGFNRGPIVAIGSRATIHQGQLYRSGGRETTFLPSFRTVIDMANEGLESNLAGGPSDRRFSRWYCNDLENWQSGTYKRLSSESTLPFPL